MLALKTLKPFYIKADEDYVYIVLTSHGFSVCLSEEIYDFVPLEDTEIKINRRTKEVINKEGIFTFQKEDNILHIRMEELGLIPDFIIQIHALADYYYYDDHMSKAEIDDLMNQLERNNLKKLIDRALDERDEKTFYTLIKDL